MAETSPRGRFEWHELLTSDTDAAAKFYPAVTGWGIMPFADDPSYRMWTVAGVPIGGLLALPDEAKAMGEPPNWLPYIAVPDVDMAVRQAMAMSARTYVEPRDIPNVGRFAVLADPQGATFAVYSAAGRWPGHEGPATIGEFSWHELMTSDWRSALVFYQALFGWDTTSSMDMGPGGIYQMFGRNGIPLGGIYNKPPNVEGGARWLSYVRVPDADKLVKVVVKRGGAVVSGPMEVPGGDRIVTCRDPQGAQFAVHTLAADIQASGGGASSSAPAAKAPAAKAPAAKAPAAKAPAAKASAAKAPAAKASAAKAPAAKAPAAKAPAAKAAAVKRAPARVTKKARRGAKPRATARSRARTRSKAKAASSRGTRRKSAGRSAAGRKRAARVAARRTAKLTRPKRTTRGSASRRPAGPKRRSASRRPAGGKRRSASRGPAGRKRRR
jgi:uncharacterized protein